VQAITALTAMGLGDIAEEQLVAMLVDVRATEMTLAPGISAAGIGLNEHFSSACAEPAAVTAAMIAAAQIPRIALRSPNI
jgi:hypothetical protein